MDMNKLSNKLSIPENKYYCSACYNVYILKNEMPSYICPECGSSAWMEEIFLGW